jgi:transcriptional regulator with XRE-family HTH domain
MPYKAYLSREWSQADLAKRAGMAQRKVSAVESGKANITLATLLRLTRALGIMEITL